MLIIPVKLRFSDDASPPVIRVVHVICMIVLLFCLFLLLLLLVIVSHFVLFVQFAVQMPMYVCLIDVFVVYCRVANFHG